MSMSLQQAQPERVDCFSVFSTADPSALPRVFEVFSLHGLIPTRCHSACADGDADQLVIDIQVSALPQGLADQLARRLRRVITVTEVLWSEKRPAGA